LPFQDKRKTCTKIYWTIQDEEQRGEVAYQLELPPQLSDMHDVFHVSQLRKCLRVPEELMLLEELTVSEDHMYQEYLVRILDTSEKVTQNNR
jgi:hypothetical protein